jgi:hypothetical protein
MFISALNSGVNGLAAFQAYHVLDRRRAGRELFLPHVFLMGMDQLLVEMVINLVLIRTKMCL